MSHNLKLYINRDDYGEFHVAKIKLISAHETGDQG